MSSSDEELVPRTKRKGSGGRFLGTFVGQAAGGIARVGMGIALARVLGPSGFGAFSLATAITVGLFTIAGLSVTTGATYVVARAEQRDRAAFPAMGLGWLIGAVITGLGLVLLTLSEPLLPSALDVGIARLAILAAMPYLIVNMAAFASLGAGRYVTYNILSSGYYVVSGAAAVAGAAVSGSAFGSMVFWTAATTVWALGGTCVVGRRALPPRRRGVEHEWRQMVRFGLPAHVSNVLTFANYRLDLMLVGVFLGAAGAGQYSAVVGVAEMVWFISVTASTVLFTEVAGNRDAVASRLLAERVARLVLWSTVVVSICIALAAQPLLTLLYSEEFADSSGALQVLMIGVVALSLSRVLANHTAGIGQPGRNIIGSLIALAVTIGLDLVLIPPWGVLGAAVASSVAYTAALVNRLVVFERTSPVVRSGGLGYLRPRISDARLVGEIVRSVVRR